MAGRPEPIHTDRLTHPTSWSLSAHAGPLIFKQVSGALVFSQEVKSLADRVVSLLLRLAQGGGYMAVHTRVEVDWQVSKAYSPHVEKHSSASLIPSQLHDDSY